MLKILRQRKTYTSCNDLPLHNFIKIVVYGDLSYLYAEPAKFIHRQADLAAIWEVIFNEYNELTNNTNSRHIFELIKDITVLGNRIQLIEDCINLLESVKSVSEYQPTIDILHSFGCGHIIINDETRYKNLPRCRTICKRFIIELNQKESEYQILNKDEDNKVTEQDFYQMIAVVSKFMNGKDIDLHKTTVSLYISYINLMKANIEANG